MSKLLKKYQYKEKKVFEKSGGEKFGFIPCLNDNDDHINLLEHLILKNITIMNLYLIIKSLHLIAVISWMAGLLYLPRIFVYHVENFEKKKLPLFFETMEKRLYNFIMRPAMLFSWIFGIVLIYIKWI